MIHYTSTIYHIKIMLQISKIDTIDKSIPK